ncbi:hypothetical protein H4582DRAFT_1926001, partial [Lactarius indigo]
MQVATDHAFTGTYVVRFRTNDPPENISCPCGAPLRSPEHLIHRCPRFLTSRISAGVLSAAYAPIHPVYPYTALFSTLEGASRLLSFLQLSRAASRPESGPPPPEVPPEP